MRVKCSCCGKPVRITSGERRENNEFSYRYGTCTFCSARLRVNTEVVIVSDPVKLLTFQQKNWLST